MWSSTAYIKLLVRHKSVPCFDLGISIFGLVAHSASKLRLIFFAASIFGRAVSIDLVE